MALPKFHTILETEAGNLSTTVNFVKGDPFELEKERYTTDQTNPHLGVPLPDVDDIYRQNDQIDSAYRVVFFIMKHQPIDGKQGDRWDDMWTLRDLAQEYIYRIRNNADVKTVTHNRKELNVNWRPRYGQGSDNMYGWETSVTISYVDNVNIDNS